MTGPQLFADPAVRARLEHAMGGIYTKVYVLDDLFHHGWTTCKVERPGPEYSSDRDGKSTAVQLRCGRRVVLRSWDWPSQSVSIDAAYADGAVPCPSCFSEIDR